MASPFFFFSVTQKKGVKYLLTKTACWITKLHVVEVPLRLSLPLGGTECKHTELHHHFPHSHRFEAHSSVMAPRILLCGDVLGRLSQLFKRVSSVPLSLSLSLSTSRVYYHLHSFRFRCRYTDSCAVFSGEQIGGSIRRALVRGPVLPGLAGAARRVHGLR